jgi:hypothetical protein
MMVQSILQTVLALGAPLQPPGPVAVFNLLAILVWLSPFAGPVPRSVTVSSVGSDQTAAWLASRWGGSARCLRAR